MASETSARLCHIRLEALALACVLFGLPTPSLGGMLDTALPTFSDATPAQVVAYVPAVVKNNAVETVVICTNLDSAPVHIGLEVFDKAGALVNSVNAGNGALLNVAVGATVSIATGTTKLLTEDYKITLLPTLQNGSGRVVASTPNVSCNALLTDEIHEILEPPSTLAPPSLVRTPVLSCGDGECSAEVGEDLTSCPDDCTDAPICGNETCDTGETCQTCPADCGVCPPADCPNGTCSGGETCQTCPADCGFCGTQLNKSEQKCVAALNRGLSKVAKAQNRENHSCVKNGAFEKLSGTIEACIIADPKRKVQKQKDKNTAKATLRCFDPPPYAATDPNTGNQLGMDEPLALVHDVFGPSLDSAIIGISTDKDAAKCQIDVIKNVNRCVDTSLKVFNKCKKDGLKGKSAPPGAGNPFGFASDVGLCLGFDPSNRIMKFCDTKLQSSIESRCDADLDKFPGCNTPTPPATETELKVCVQAKATCHTCRMVNQADDLGLDCTLFGCP